MYKIIFFLTYATTKSKTHTLTHTEEIILAQYSPSGSFLTILDQLFILSLSSPHRQISSPLFKLLLYVHVSFLRVKKLVEEMVRM